MANNDHSEQPLEFPLPVLTSLHAQTVLLEALEWDEEETSRLLVAAQEIVISLMPEGYSPGRRISEDEARAIYAILRNKLLEIASEIHIDMIMDCLVTKAAQEIAKLPVANQEYH